jgi:hypothetical protein
MGTQYAREVCQIFRETAEKTKLPNVKESLLALADELEPIVSKLYFKTQKGTEDMEQMAKDMPELKDKLLACQNAEEAKILYEPVCSTLEKIIKHVKTMKVRMT